MKYSIRYIVSICLFCFGYSLYSPHISNGQTQTEYIRMTRPLYSKIDTVDKKESSIIVNFTNPLTSEEKNIIEKSIQDSSFIKQVKYNNRNVELILSTSSVGYVWSKASGSFVVFYDSTADKKVFSSSNENKASKTKEIINRGQQSNKKINNKSVERVVTKGDRGNQNKEERVKRGTTQVSLYEESRAPYKDRVVNLDTRKEGLVVDSNKRAKEEERRVVGAERNNGGIQREAKQREVVLDDVTIAQQIGIIESRRTIPQSEQGHSIREAIKGREGESLLQRIFGVGVVNAQTTGKQRINMGGPEEWKPEGGSRERIEKSNREENIVSSPASNPPSRNERENPISIGKEPENTPIQQQNSGSIRGNIGVRKEEDSPTQPQNIRRPVEQRSDTSTNSNKEEQAIKQPVQEEIRRPIENQRVPVQIAPQPAPASMQEVQNKAVESGKESPQEGQEQAKSNNNTFEVVNYEEQKKIVMSLLNRGDYKKALEMLKGLAKQSLPKTEKEEILYLIADMTEVLSREDKLYLPEAINSYNVAMNFNLQSKNVPDALLQLGLLNSKMGNTKEVEAYFSIIRTKYPNNKNVPLTYYYLGKYYQDKKEYSKALVQYKTLEERYPQFEFLKEVIVEIIHSLTALGYYNDAKPYIGFIDGRWPSLYQTYPDILLTKAKLYFDLKDYKMALDSYWHYVNIVPKSKDIDMIMSHIGDSYFQLGEADKARSVYRSIVQKYKGTEGYVLAKIRLAEDNIIDDITDDTQFLGVLDRSYSTRAKDTYEEIINEYKKSEFAAIAEVKLGLWHFWMKDYIKALSVADSFKSKYPNNSMIASIETLIARSLNAIATNETMQKQIPSLWNKYKTIFKGDDSLAPEYRLNIAEALSKEGELTEAKEVLQPFFKGRRYNEISEKATLLVLEINKKIEDWKGIEDIYYRVLDWDLSRPVYSVVLFDTGVAFQSMEEYEKANVLFERLFSSVFTSPYYKGLSAYFIANNGLRMLKSPASVYPFAQESLNSLLLASKQKEKDVSEEALNTSIIRSLVQLREITEKLGATEETLRYLMLQEQYEPDNILLQIEKAKLMKKKGNVAEWKKILESIINKDPTSSYAKLARSELISEENKNNLRKLSQ